MESKEKNAFQITKNHFSGIDSEFLVHTALNTSANQTRPFYAQISLCSTGQGMTILGLKTSQSIILVYFKGTEFLEHKKLVFDDIRLDKHITYFTFRKPVYSTTNPPMIYIGYRSGLVALAHCNDQKIIRVFNYDEKTKQCYKKEPVTMITVVPDSGGDQILVLYQDSTVMKYLASVPETNMNFIEKLKKLESKISFNKEKNRLKHQRKKNKNNICYGSLLNDSFPEFNYFFAENEDLPIKNPLQYLKFNHRTITDITIKKHKSFTKTLLKGSINTNEPTVFAFTSLDGYLLIYDYSQMTPLLSYKGVFGGFNTLTFSENCELIALSGQDDCITVLDLNSLETIRCEGHKSFVCKTIFQPIPLEGDMGDKQEDTMDKRNPQCDEHVRIISGSMDASLGFWEFPLNIFPQKRSMEEKLQFLPLRIRPLPRQRIIAPVHLEPTKDAIGWIEKYDNMLIQCGFDGVIQLYVISSISKPQPKEGDDTPVTPENLTKSPIKSHKKERRDDQYDETTADTDATPKHFHNSPKEFNSSKNDHSGTHQGSE